MTARLYQFVGSPYCAKVRKILDFKGIEYEVVELDYLERKELLAASGQWMVPALTLDGGETIADSAKIAARLEELQPEPTILPPGWRGMHRVLADYIDNQLEDALFRAAIPDELEHWRERGADRVALWRFIRERKFGAGFVDRMIAGHAAEMARAAEALAPFDEALGERPFILGRIGLADFALYGQLYYFAFRGELKIPGALANLRTFFGRMDRISSAPEPA
ncbi:MAG TPA: glutathione S-transferase family protein [Candidatus Binataceae bacterium]|nr:glutathione S-transferase family protein [Candidatus Binataceae bacterium]